MCHGFRTGNLYPHGKELNHLRIVFSTVLFHFSLRCFTHFQRSLGHRFSPLLSSVRSFHVFVKQILLPHSASHPEILCQALGVLTDAVLGIHCCSITPNQTVTYSSSILTNPVFIYSNLTTPSPKSLEITDLLTASIMSHFPECPVSGIIQRTAFSSRNVHSKFIQAGMA